MSDPTHRLTAGQVVPFLKSVIASGEQLSSEDIADIDAALSTPPPSLDECGYTCPYASWAHETDDRIGHDFTRRSTP